MKTNILGAVLLSIAFSQAHAQSRVSSQTKCITEAAAISTAASYRDTGRSPQDAFSTMKDNYTHDGVSVEWVKATINAVYFDPELRGARGDVLRRQYLEECANPSSGYRPLD